MHKFLLITIFICLYILPTRVQAQDKKPKVALVLSGGGAKGVAHIPLLQTLDSLGIVPDIIIGTSMGGVVGGFYATGYSGDSIANIALNANWTELLGGDISLNKVSMEEKSEFKRHIVDFNIVKGKPKLNSGLLKDQKLREFISIHTYPVYDIKDFDKLPIPYRAMTTDIVNGKEILLDSGSLSQAMRATMSIPAVFQPIPYENTLLVDGGIMNNFPVDVALEMGYDFIIGSDVGGGMQSKDKLESISAQLFQAAMLTSNLKNPVNRENCDILVDHMPNLTFSTGDFANTKEIYLQGKIGTNSQLEKLTKLANKLKKYKQRVHKLPARPEEIVLDSVIYKGISDANLDLVEARTNLKSGIPYKTKDIINSIDKAMGTNLFNQITFEGGNTEEKKELILTGDERSRNSIKGSLHYDTYRGVGVLVNYTGRNILGESSRFLATIDIAEQLRFRLQYQKQFGPNKSWWWRSELLGEFLEQKFYLEGDFADDMDSRFFQINNQFNKNLNSHHDYLGLELNYETSFIEPKVDPDVNNNILNLRHYEFDNFEIGLNYNYNSINQVFFPTSGTYLKGGISRSIINNIDAEFVDINGPIPGDEQVVNGSTNDFTKLKLDFEKRLYVSEKTTGIIGANAAFIFQDELKQDDLDFSTYGYSGSYSIGGVVQNPRKNSYLFPGFHEDELFVNQMLRLNLGLQMNPFSKFYFTPHLNIASVGFNDFDEYIEDAFSPKGNWSESIETSGIFSTGVNFAYHSLLGPVNLDVSYVNDINKVRVFFSVGILFNRSN